jgi:hypothetical protein
MGYGDKTFYSSLFVMKWKITVIIKNFSFRFTKFEAGINLLRLVASWSRSEGWTEKRSSRPYKVWSRDVTMCGGTSNSLHACVKPLHRNRLAQRCPKSFPRVPLLVSKNNHESSHPCSLITVSGRLVSKTKNLYLRYDFKQKPIHSEVQKF